MSTAKQPTPDVAQGWSENYGVIEHKLGGVPLPAARSIDVPPVKPGAIKPNTKPKE